ncbi:hypothetical protein HDU93_001545 [Gonapodya sp. JEL0774]|nr:hypothetical protein HDU93_001545 [Gonapodya sp. JEL0774]
MALGGTMYEPNRLISPVEEAFCPPDLVLPEVSTSDYVPAIIHQVPAALPTRSSPVLGEDLPASLTGLHITPRSLPIPVSTIAVDVTATELVSALFQTPRSHASFFSDDDEPLAFSARPRGPSSSVPNNSVHNGGISTSYDFRARSADHLAKTITFALRSRGIPAHVLEVGSSGVEGGLELDEDVEVEVGVGLADDTAWDVDQLMAVSRNARAKKKQRFARYLEERDAVDDVDATEDLGDLVRKGWNDFDGVDVELASRWSADEQDAKGNPSLGHHSGHGSSEDESEQSDVLSEYSESESGEEEENEDDVTTSNLEESKEEESESDIDESESTSEIDSDSREDTTDEESHHQNEHSFHDPSGAGTAGAHPAFKSRFELSSQPGDSPPSSPPPFRSSPQKSVVVVQRGSQIESSSPVIMVRRQSRPLSSEEHDSSLAITPKARLGPERRIYSRGVQSTSRTSSPDATGTIGGRQRDHAISNVGNSISTEGTESTDEEDSGDFESEDSEEGSDDDGDSEEDYSSGDSSETDDEDTEDDGTEVETGDEDDEDDEEDNDVPNSELAVPNPANAVQEALTNSAAVGNGIEHHNSPGNTELQISHGPKERANRVNGDPQHPSTSGVLLQHGPKPARVVIRGFPSTTSVASMHKSTSSGAAANGGNGKQADPNPSTSAGGPLPNRTNPGPPLFGESSMNKLRSGSDLYCPSMGTLSHDLTIEVAGPLRYFPKPSDSSSVLVFQNRAGTAVNGERKERAANEMFQADISLKRGQRVGVGVSSATTRRVGVGGVAGGIIEAPDPRQTSTGALGQPLLPRTNSRQGVISVGLHGGVAVQQPQPEWPVSRGPSVRAAGHTQVRASGILPERVPTLANYEIDEGISRENDVRQRVPPARSIAISGRSATHQGPLEAMVGNVINGQATQFSQGNPAADGPAFDCGHNSINDPLFNSLGRRVARVRAGLYASGASVVVVSGTTFGFPVTTGGPHPWSISFSNSISGTVYGTSVGSSSTSNDLQVSRRPSSVAGTSTSSRNDTDDKTEMPEDESFDGTAESVEGKARTLHVPDLYAEPSRKHWKNVSIV